MIKNIELGFESLFLNGSKPTLDEVLDNREKRVEFLRKLFSLYPHCTIISFKLNIPGEIKNNEYISQIFDIGLKHISSCVKNENWESVYSKKINLRTGPEYFDVITALPLGVKEKMVSIEENVILGRIFDIDVIYEENENLYYVERGEIGYPNRKCFICSCDAKLCSSRRTHSVLEIHKSMGNLIKQDGSIKL
jgi:holo-ACP synthase CitX